MEEHDKRVAQEAAELESKAKETTDKTEKVTASNETTVAGGDAASIDNATNDGAGNGGEDAQGQASENYNDNNTNENNSGYSDNSYTNNDSNEQTGGNQSSDDSEESTVAVVTINVKTRNAGFLVNGATVAVEDGVNVFKLMQQAQNNGILTIDYRTTAYGKYISAINGIYESGSQAGWKYQVNGVDASVGVSSTKVHNGDVITWYYVNSASETLDY